MLHVLHNYILTPPIRTKNQLKFTTTWESKGELDPPNIEILKQYNIPIWGYKIGDNDESRITILFSHGNQHDVPKGRDFVIDLFTQISNNNNLSVFLILWDYPGYSYSPLTTKEFPLMVDHLKALCREITTGDLSKQIGREKQPLFLVGHSIGASLQTHVLNDYDLSCNINGIYSIAPFYNLQDMCNRYAFGTILFTAFVKKYADFCNMAENIITRGNKDIPLHVVLCARDRIVTSGPGAIIKFEDLLPDRLWVSIFDGDHNSPILDTLGREWCAKHCANFILTCLQDSQIIEVA